MKRNKMIITEDLLKRNQKITKMVLFPVPVGIACVSSVDTFHGVMKQLKVVLL